MVLRCDRMGRWLRSTPLGRERLAKFGLLLVLATVFSLLLQHRGIRRIVLADVIVNGSRIIAKVTHGDQTVRGFAVVDGNVPEMPVVGNVKIIDDSILIGTNKIRILEMYSVGDNDSILEEEQPSGNAQLIASTFRFDTYRIYPSSTLVAERVAAHQATVILIVGPTAGRTGISICPAS